MQSRQLQSCLWFFAVVMLVIAMIAVTAGWENFEASRCAERAAAMQVNYVYYPLKGCYIQQPNGSWIPLDPPSAYVP